MRLTILFLTAAFLNVSAKGVSQSITFSGKNVPLETVFSVVEQQTGYMFLYPQNSLKVAKFVTIQAKDQPLLEFLEALFARQPFSYSIESKTINITVATASPVIRPSLPEIEKLVAPSPITGRITDSLGKPLTGVTVTVTAPGRGAYSATATDNKGRFEILANKGEKLSFSIVGYSSVSVTVGDQKEINIIMKPAAAALDSLVVQSVNTGYQRIRPEQSTGAVSQISTKEYESRISTNFLDGLVNRLPGLMINNNVFFNSNVPGVGQSSKPLFNIRGISTMSANQNPLIVVDGYPTELSIDMIDPNEIKSVTILKDAAAATVYGVRASNGVIVIERKQAAVGKPQFAFRATAGITPEENYSRYRWAEDQSSVVVNYLKDINAANVNSNTWNLQSTNTAGTGGAIISRNPVFLLMAQQAAKIVTPDQAAKSYASMVDYNNTDEYNRLFLRTALTQSYNFNVSGGSNTALYYITANHTRNLLNDINNNNNRLSLSARTTLKFTRRLSLELTTDYQEQRSNGAPVPDITAIHPYEHLTDVNGAPASISGQGITPNYNNVLLSMGLEDNRYYPLVEADAVTNKTRSINNRITANFKYIIGSGFDLTFGGIYETFRSDYQHLATAASLETRAYINEYAILNADGTVKLNIPRGDFLQQRSDATTGYTGRAQLNYNKKIGSQHSFNGILGAEVRKLINSSYLTSQFGYNDETLLLQPVDYAGMVGGTVKGNLVLSSPLQSNYDTYFNQQYTEDRFLSGYGNLVYSFRNTYSLSGSIRVDQSNLFGTNPKYKYKPFWSLGGAWNIHKENFMKDISWIDVLKIRLAYGFNGNVAKMSLPQVIAYSALNSYTSPATPALKLLSYANSSLRWEQTKSFNIGLDYRIFKNIYGSLDYYKKNSSDLLGNSQIDPTIGVSPSLINQASINNHGIELSLHADWIVRPKFNWNTGLVIARNTSKVLDVYRTGDYNPESLNSVGFVKGQPVGAMFAYRYAGLDTAGYPLITNAQGQQYRTNTSTLTNPTSIAKKSDTSGLTRYIGSSIPTINAGLSNRVDVGNFYVFCMINYYGGFKVAVPRPNPSALRPLEGAGNYWKVKGDENKTDVMALVGYNSANANYAYNYADRYVVNGDYITLGDLTVSYSLDNLGVIKRSGFSHFEVKCQASNIWTVGLNDYNFSMATGSYQKSYVTPTYTIGIFTNF